MVWSVLIVRILYSFLSRVKACCSSLVNLWHQPTPVFGQEPLIPSSNESEKVVMVGFLEDYSVD